MDFMKMAPVRFLLLISGAWLVVFLLTRTVLLLAHLDESGGNALSVFGVGLVYDLGFLAYAILPMGLYLLLCPAALWRRRGHRWFLQGLLTVSLFTMLFISVAEWLFWDEFGVRFNFIAVDYLVYSDEVLNNVLESYPIGILLTILAVVAVGLSLALRKPLQAALDAPLPALRGRLAIALGLLALTGLSLQLLSQDAPRTQGGNAYQNELASNGPYQFFAAFRNNELDYGQFYSSLPPATVAPQIRAELNEPNAHFIDEDPQGIRRRIDNPGTLRKPNIVLVTIESLSAKYLGSNGDKRDLTPNLDALRKQSLYFNRFYATGTRTDRGLEAITLAIPPTPGRSIVKRIGRESGFASLGQQLSAIGYDSVFVYGGRGYFDNMNAFFSGNGYRVVDQSSVEESEIHFKNAWGMADEDLYKQTLKLADANYAKQRPFLLQLMTTSNHRPYTYPDNRIDIKSGNGRDGAVKYTDYAIGQFLDQARQKPWFDNTIFVFVADHTAGSAGKEDLPISNYQIPLFVYAPKLIEPRETNQLASQIDLAPTLLGLLNLDYESTFFGRNLLQDNPLPPRVVVGNYQHLGMFDGKDLAILSPRQGLRRHDDALTESRESRATSDDPLISRAIAYYQTASYGFKQQLLGWRAPMEGAEQVSER
ncbi:MULTISPECIES: LTA synthase family protein [unclassified Pseudomonas]|uniref:LTA synthase family protein n=1 Tax=unclassified Pseudomonas TaxID=196821 RepID=UPI00119B9DC3|nr:MULTISPECIES: LTA synthase family protein [unclassified Pseudomonas]TWC20570.1 phosphoglycerol transferase MdoB-like AlkP superfamily enzyme [Pseudomonas sp. SJZ075]TWC25550.1 phosphoglycerol transferase MdoB-like AlkP superfamily enzyme [Pseudomonas sp. SJZ074]TWC36000.1 phosphoglycerol transferase MdoB-like AlkP superfamily enzyme [Pseudomonas sp. SJZ078]TWC42361.1 phosphoglycerol transferase MdoB-like AlkP superfamily enzyme [Pseudomonas sp. SJZ085]TWC56868.1 phosphoglycerol transferase 